MFVQTVVVFIMVQISQWVVSTVLAPSNPKDRAKIIRRMVKLCKVRLKI